jgi:signal transduction histidine kinase
MNTRFAVRLPRLLLALSCLPLLVGGLAAWELHSTQRGVSEVMATNARSMRAAEEIAIGVRDMQIELNHFLLGGDVAAFRKITAMRRDTDFWVAEARRTALTDHEFVLIDRLTHAYEHFFGELARIEEQESDDQQEAVRELLAQGTHILRPVQEYLDFNEVEIQRISEENRQLGDRMAIGLLLLGVCGPLGGLLVGFALARAVNRSLVRLSVPIHDAAGKLDEVVGPITVSAGLGLEGLEAVLRRLAEQTATVVARLQQSQREALRAEQLAAVGQIAAGVAHELRNPLMSMKILVQSAGEGAGLTARDLAVLEEEITRLEHLTATFLDFARPPRPERRPFPVQALLDDTIDLVAGRAGQRDVRIDRAFPDAPVWVEGDAAQVRQVVLNLLLNALDALPDGGAVMLALAEEPGVRGRRWVVLRVADTGPGLPAELAQDIFTPFVSTKPTGLGLGLSISRRIVEAHGGEITAANRPGGGAVFCVRLPGLVADGTYGIIGTDGTNGSHQSDTSHQQEARCRRC